MPRKTRKKYYSGPYAKSKMKRWANESGWKALSKSQMQNNKNLRYYARIASEANINSMSLSNPIFSY